MLGDGGGSSKHVDARGNSSEIGTEAPPYYASCMVKGELLFRMKTK